MKTPQYKDPLPALAERHDQHNADGEEQPKPDRNEHRQGNGITTTLVSDGPRDKIV
jgi:hypothetical protein